jgi:hypothetical protein
LNGVDFISELRDSVIHNFKSPLVAYGKRSTKIKERIIDCLNTGHSEWEEQGEAFPTQIGMEFVFIPNKRQSNWLDDFDYTESQKYIYAEYDFKRENNVCNLDAVVNTELLFKNQRYTYAQNTISRSANEIVFECFIKPKPVKFISSKIDEDGFKVTEQREKVHPEKAGIHVVGKAIALGGTKYVTYVYKTKNRKLSPEEIDYWIQMFDYARIDF